MRTFMFLWILPVSFLIMWYGLSVNDWSGGLWFFSREMHDIVMKVYADAMGLTPQDMPPLLARALVVDTGFVMAIMAFRHRKWLKPRVQAFMAS